MIIDDGKRYRGISYHGGALVFRYTDTQGREHRIRCQTLHEAIALYHTKRDMASKGGMPGPAVLRRGKVTFRDIARDALAYSDKHKRSARNDHHRKSRSALQASRGCQRHGIATGRCFRSRTGWPLEVAKSRPFHFSAPKSLGVPDAEY